MGALTKPQGRLADTSRRLEDQALAAAAVDVGLDPYVLTDEDVVRPADDAESSRRRILTSGSTTNR